MFGESNLIALANSLLTPNINYGNNYWLSEPIFGLFVRIIGTWDVYKWAYSFGPLA